MNIYWECLHQIEAVLVIANLAKGHLIIFLKRGSTVVD
jgi:hypothetical protein